MDSYIFIITLALGILLALIVAGIVSTKIIKLLLSIRATLYDKYVSFSPEVNKLVDLAENYWRLQKQIKKVSTTIDPNDIRRINNSLQRIDEYLKINDIEIIDLTNHSYNDGLNIEILAREQDPQISHSIIFDVHQPTIRYKGTPRKRLQAIIHDPPTPKDADKRHMPKSSKTKRTKNKKGVTNEN